MLDDPDYTDMGHFLPNQGDNIEAANEMYGTIKREEAAGADSSKHSYVYQQHHHDTQNSQSHNSEESMPLELIIKGKREKLTDEEIQKLIDENYH